jgi:plastocyanin
MHRRRLRALVLLLAVLGATVLVGAPPAVAGAGCHRPPTEGRGSTLALSELCFSPTVLRVDPGSEVTIVNRDPIAHPLGRPGGEWFWDGGLQARTTVRMAAGGTYPFFCYTHPGMVGVVVVGDGQGTGTPIVEVAGPAAATAGTPTQADPGPPPASFPTAWLVLVALAALVGAVTGTRLAARGRRA